MVDVRHPEGKSSKSVACSTLFDKQKIQKKFCKYENLVMFKNR